MSLSRLLRPLLAATLFATASAGAKGVKDAELGKFWSDDAAHVPYRAIQTGAAPAGQRLTLVVFLHGDWQDGTDNESQLAGYGNGSMELIDEARKAHTPLVYVAPQTTDAYWPPARVAAVVADALKRYPRCFAAGVPMSGMTEPSGLKYIVDIPQWIFHGEKDDDTDVEWGYGGAQVGSRLVVRALRAFGGKPIYTEYPGEKHVIWSRAYADRKLLPWILAQRLPGPPCRFED